MAGVRDRHGSRDGKPFFWRAEMVMVSYRRSLVALVILVVGVSLCGGCADLKYHEIFGAGLAGAAVGAIVGHQSDECGAGAVVGAAVFATGDLLCQIDRINEQNKVEKAKEEVAKGNSLLDHIQWE
jgi:hypothetical protein